MDDSPTEKIPQVCPGRKGKSELVPRADARRVWKSCFDDLRSKKGRVFSGSHPSKQWHFAHFAPIFRVMESTRPHRGFLAVALVGLLASTALAQNNQLTPEERNDGWQLLFDGKSLDGWTSTGNRVAWVVEDGMIQCRPGGGGWLRTNDQYRDFELLAEFKIGPGGNSGLAIRASSTGDPAFTGMELQIYDDFGKEPRLNSCGAVYNAIMPTVQAVNPAGEWNTYRVLLKGDVLNVWLNGKHIHVDAKLDERGIRHRAEDKVPLNTRVKSGYIAVQDHGDGAYFRNFKIRPIDVHPLDRAPGPGEAMWVDLFNGRNTDGWFAKGQGSWTVENGVLIGRDGVSHLYSDGIFTDFELRAKAWIIKDGNSGFYFRAKPPAANPDSWPEGYEAQIDHNDPKNFTGSLYARAWPEKMITREEEWFDYNIRCVGNHITIAIDGQTMLETSRDEFDTGHVALQGHNPGSEVRWRDIQIRPLNQPTARSPRPLSDGIVDVFYCTHSAGFRHDVLPESRAIMERLGEEHDWLRVMTSDDIADLTPELLQRLDVVMFYTTGELPMSESQKAAFVDFCERGKGFVGVHSATDTFYQWPWYVQHVGGSFDGHPWHEHVTIKVLDPEHPATRHFGSDTFEITDEIYKFRNHASDRHVLTQLDGGSVKDLASGYFPDSSWTRTTGQGRMFYTALGHRSEVWNDQRFIDHLLGGIRWAAGVED